MKKRKLILRKSTITKLTKIQKNKIWGGTGGADGTETVDGGDTQNNDNDCFLFSIFE
ncbi:class I lanthipeptide [Aquimarina sp. SS2-1]|uniref:class I lanthipeptide n=1 Tax=Aquimarina besae TaxID=3342247 RepID=UPI00366CB32E